MTQNCLRTIRNHLQKLNMYQPDLYIDLYHGVRHFPPRGFNPMVQIISGYVYVLHDWCYLSLHHPNSSPVTYFNLSLSFKLHWESQSMLYTAGGGRYAVCWETALRWQFLKR